MDIQLIIKAPNQNVDDFVVNCNLDWTIDQLKNYLSHSYPNNPGTEQQKLIYSGRLLHDHLQLKDVLRQDDGQLSTHIFHLVCSNDSSYYHAQQSTSSQNWYSQSSISEDSEGIDQSSESTLRHRNINPEMAINSNYPQLPTVLPSATPGFMPISQIAAMQQMYAYYFSQYMQSMNAGTVPRNNTVFPYHPNLEQTVNNIETPPPPPQRPINQRNNAQGPLLMNEIEEGVHRDWLELVFLSCRFFVLFCIVYFYSSPERLMIVIVGTIVIFLYHEGWFVRRFNPVVAPDVYLPQGVPNHEGVLPEHENNENRHHLVNQDLQANLEVHNEHELEDAMDGEEPPHVQNPDVVNNNHIFSPLTFLQIFFSSLIPEPPPAVNIN